MAGLLDAARAVLANARLADLVPKRQDVVLLEHNATVAEALKKLMMHRILSAPLVVSPGLEDVESLTPGESAPMLLGWLDVRVIIQAFLQYLKEGGKELPTNMLQLMAQLDKQGPHFANKLLITLISSDDRGLVYQADASASALAAVQGVFLHQPKGIVHRLAIFDAHGEITQVISQLDVLRYLLQHKEELGAAVDLSIADLGLLNVPGKRALVTLPPHLPTLLAFERMAAAGVTGAAVVSEEGELIANLSVSDVRCIQPQHLGVLALPVAEFLALSHGTSYLGYSAEKPLSHSKPGMNEHPFFAGVEGSRRGPGDPRDPSAEPVDDAGMALRRITCKETSTLGEVLHMLVDNGVHRVYTVSQDGPLRVNGVITPTDILRLLASERPDAEGNGTSAAGATKLAKRSSGSGSLQAAIDAGAAVPGGVAPNSDERQHQDQDKGVQQEGNGHSKKARLSTEDQAA